MIGKRIDIQTLITNFNSFLKFSRKCLEIAEIEVDSDPWDDFQEQNFDILVNDPILKNYNKKAMEMFGAWGEESNLGFVVQRGSEILVGATRGGTVEYHAEQTSQDTHAIFRDFSSLDRRHTSSSSRLDFVIGNMDRDDQERMISAKLKDCRFFLL